MKKWEIKFEYQRSLSSEEATTLANQEWTSGWELVTILPNHVPSFAQRGHCIYVFKREIPEPLAEEASRSKKLIDVDPKILDEMFPQ